MTVGGRTRHVFGYLEDFLFPPERAQAKVKMLSGGERNRLLLARLLTQPANVLILDEPTNDLDLETLSVLEAELADFPGHDSRGVARSRVSRKRRDEHVAVRGRRPHRGIRGHRLRALGQTGRCG